MHVHVQVPRPLLVGSVLNFYYESIQVLGNSIKSNASLLFACDFHLFVYFFSRQTMNTRSVQRALNSIIGQGGRPTEGRIDGGKFRDGVVY